MSVDSVKQQLVATFRRLDSESSGVISRAKLLQALVSSETLREDEVLAFLQHVNAFDDARVDYELLLSHIFPTEPQEGVPYVGWPERGEPQMGEPSQRFTELLKAVEEQTSPALADALLQEHGRELQKAVGLNALLKKELQALRQELRELRQEDPEDPTLADRRGQVITTISTERSMTDRLAKVEDRMKPRTGWDEEKAASPFFWSLTQADRTQKGGPHHVDLEQKADLARSRNDAIERECQELKAQLVESRAKLQAMQEQFGQGQEPAAVSVNLVEIMKDMEAKDLRLAALRREDLRNIESIRGLKIRAWRLILDDQVDTILEEIEKEMRCGKDSWFTGKKHQEMRQCEEAMKALNFQMQDEMSELLDRAQDLLASCSSDELTLSDMPDDTAWAVIGESDPLIDRISKSNFELQIMAWTLSHTMNRKLSVLRKLEKLRRAEGMLQRQVSIQRVVAFGDSTTMMAELERLTHFSGLLTAQNQATLEAISEKVSGSRESREHLRAMKHAVSRQASDLRDELLKQMRDIVEEDVRLAWLRKSHLQMIELRGMLQNSLAALPESRWQDGYQLVGTCSPSMGDISSSALKACSA